MSIFKRGNVYWFHFIFDGRHYQQSTKQGSKSVARQIEASVRSDLAKGKVGIKKQQPVPTFEEFKPRRDGRNPKAARSGSPSHNRVL